MEELNNLIRRKEMSLSLRHLHLLTRPCKLEVSCSLLTPSFCNLVNVSVRSIYTSTLRLDSSNCCINQRNGDSKRQRELIVFKERGRVEGISCSATFGYWGPNKSSKRPISGTRIANDRKWTLMSL